MLFFRPSFNFFVIALLFFSFVTQIVAEDFASLQVFVTDQKGDVVPNVNVRLENKDGFSREFITSKSQLIFFSNVTKGVYSVKLEARGFKSYSREIEINAGKNELTVQLEVAEIVENVEVARDRQELATDEVFSNFLTKEQIDALPDDPEELERELRNQFGQDAVILIDGFPGRMPAKSQIASIRVTRSSFDAEYHKLGVTIIDVTTKSGAGNWNGSIGFNFNDDSFNARNPFALRRFPAQQRGFNFFLSGPLIKNKSSLFISNFASNSYKDENIFAVLPSGNLIQSIRSSSNSINPWIKFSQNLTKTHFLGITYQGRVTSSENNGVGGFNLLERAFSSKISNHQIRISETGNIGNRFFNEFRLQITNESTGIIPASNKPAIIVLDTFNSGGAGNKNNSTKQGIWLSDNFLFGFHKIHAIKIGGLFEYERRNSVLSTNQNGTFTFSSLADFIENRPSTFTQRPGTRNVKLSQIQLGVFLQDDIRVSKSLLLSAGLRYEWQNNLEDRKNFSPRFGFAWSPNKRGKTTFRGGAGIYYNWFDTNSLAVVLSRDRTQLGDTIIINPSFPDPFLVGTSQILPSSFSQTAFDLRNPYVLLGSLGLQQRLARSLSLRVLYNYEKGVHQFRSRDLNAPLNGIRPDPTFGRIVQIESSSFFVKNSLNIGLSGRLNRKISFGGEYTLSKKISDNDGIFGLPSDNYDLRLDRASSNDDQRHRIYTSVFYRLRKNLNISAIFTANSPLPYTVTTGRDDNEDSIFNDRPVGIPRNGKRGEWQKQVDMSLSWTIGLVKRKAGDISMPGTIVVTSAEASSGDIGIDPNHRFSIKIYATANNIFNQPRFANFVGVQTSPFFGKPVAASNSRKIDFGLKFSF